MARRQERLEELRDELTKHDPNLNVHLRVSDLSDERAVIDLCDWLEREKLPMDFLINNAGLGDVGPFATSERQRVEEMLAVNVTALTLLTRLLLPRMIAQRRGAILNVSSTAGFLPIAGFAVYAATKAYVTSFSEAIRAELHGSGVTVTSLCPGPVPTEFTQVAARPGAKSRPKPGIHSRLRRRNRADGARRGRVEQATRYSRPHHETRDVSRPHHAAGDLAVGVASFGESVEALAAEARVTSYMHSLQGSRSTRLDL